MSELLNDSPTAVKVRDRILNELRSGEQIYYAADGQVMEPTGGGAGDFNLFVGSVIVTSERLLVAESKMLGGARFWSVAWTDVEEVGHYPDGTVGVRKTVSSTNRWPLWKISIWEGKSHNTPLDKKRLDLLTLSIKEAQDALAAARVADAADSYEDLKRRRGF